MMSCLTTVFDSFVDKNYFGRRFALVQNRRPATSQFCPAAILNALLLSFRSKGQFAQGRPPLRSLACRSAAAVVLTVTWTQ